MTSPGPKSGLIVEIPQAEPIVSQLRERLDPSARLGVKAHITVLFPFIPPARLDVAVLGQLERLFAAVPRFAFRLDRTRWFDDQVVWLAPSDPGPFQTLTQRVIESFPAYRPYDGPGDRRRPVRPDRCLRPGLAPRDTALGAIAVRFVRKFRGVIRTAIQATWRGAHMGAGYRAGRDRGSPNHGSTLVSKRVSAQIRSPARVRTNSPVPWRSPAGART